MSKRIEIIRLGVVPYGQALALQIQLRERLKEQRDEDLVGYLIALEHPPTVTLGKRGSFNDLVNHAWLKENGVEVFKIARGGEATFHEPGQLVVYPILRLKALGMAVVDVIRGMAACLGESVAEYGKVATYDLEHPGLWTQDEVPSRKLASVGMRVQSGITTHGVAMNLVNPMIGFSMIVVCGMLNTPMARLSDYWDDDFDFNAFRDDFLTRFGAFLEVPCVDGELELPPPEEWVAANQDWSEA